MNIAMLACALSLAAYSDTLSGTFNNDTAGVRMERPLTVLAEVSYNGMAGAGVVLGYQLTPHFGVDAGAGYSQAMGKVGARARINFLTSRFTPFVAAGMSLATGTFGHVLEEANDILPARFSIGPSPYAHAMAGVSLQDPDGFHVTAGVGYAQLLTQTNFYWHAAPLPEQRRTLPSSVGSGLLASLAMGYAF